MDNFINFDFTTGELQIAPDLGEEWHIATNVIYAPLNNYHALGIPFDIMVIARDTTPIEKNPMQKRWDRTVTLYYQEGMLFYMDGTRIGTITLVKENITERILSQIEDIVTRNSLKFRPYNVIDESDLRFSGARSLVKDERAIHLCGNINHKELDEATLRWDVDVLDAWKEGDDDDVLAVCVPVFCRVIAWSTTSNKGYACTIAFTCVIEDEKATFFDSSGEVSHVFFFKYPGEDLLPSITKLVKEEISEK